MKGHVKRILWSVLIAGALTLSAAAGILDAADYAVSDRLYQKPCASDGEIVLVGIDQRALEEIGPYNEWGRDIIAMTIEALNESEECRPAVIGVDILYIGETDEELDLWLAEAAGQYGNVVTASDVIFGSELVMGADGEYELDSNAVLAVEEPYDALRDVTTQGNINVMLDADGILRHHMLQVALPDGTVVFSMALAVANRYREQMGKEPVELPEVGNRGFWYLPYCGGPGAFDESISVADLISGEISADYFAGRIVLIGPYATAMQDSYFTSIDHARPMYGIEIHANAIQALLRGNYKKEAGKGVQLVVLMLLLILAFHGFWQRRMLPATLLWAAMAGGWVLLCMGMYAQGWILHVLWVPVSVSVLYVACVASNYIRAAMEKQRVTNTFRRYVDPSVMKELLREKSDALELGGKLTDIAVLFVDIRGFTTMSELLTAPQVVEILNQYLTLTTKCVMENHGTLDKFVGDCTMAIWNAPLPQEDYVMHACRAAMAMVEGSRPLAEKLQREFGRTVSFGVGVNVGPAVVGNIGAPMRMDYTAIGDTVNTAARLEANAPAGTVYISRAVADALEGRIRVSSLGDTVRLKGKKEGFEVLVLEEIL